MDFQYLFVSFWWLIFPVFGMLMGLIGMFQSDRRATRTMDLIKAYVDQGKDPPPELLQLASAEMTNNAGGGMGRTPTENRIWSLATFGGLAAGFGIGYYVMREQEWSFAFLIVAVVMGVMALGALLLLIFGRKS